MRIDLVERVARAAHDGRRGKAHFTPDPALATSIGMAPETLARLLGQLGFVPAPPEGEQPRWRWRGRPARIAQAAVQPPRGAFAGLADLVAGSG